MTTPAKEQARQAVWDALEAEGVARFPFPPHGRIPNFAGAREAARQLMDHGLLGDVERIKVNPDAPQLPLRAMALERGIEVHVPTPRLQGGFKRLDPATIPDGKVRAAASLSKMDRWAEPVALDDLPQMDLIVAGSVAVSHQGHRVGKGEGYSDIEYAILRELGHDPVPVVTTVHPLQVQARLPRDETDLGLSLIATPEGCHEVQAPPEGPDGIHWSKLSQERIEEMPVLKDLVPS